jgi:hypothetical protein
VLKYFFLPFNRGEVPPFVKESMFSQSYLLQKIVNMWIEGGEESYTDF